MQSLADTFLSTTNIILCLVLDGGMYRGSILKFVCHFWVWVSCLYILSILEIFSSLDIEIFFPFYHIMLIILCNFVFLSKNNKHPQSISCKVKIFILDTFLLIIFKGSYPMNLSPQNLTNMCLPPQHQVFLYPLLRPSKSYQYVSASTTPTFSLSSPKTLKILPQWVYLLLRTLTHFFIPFQWLEPLARTKNLLLSCVIAFNIFFYKWLQTLCLHKNPSFFNPPLIA